MNRLDVFSCHQHALEWCLQERCNRNPSYSLRAFARDLGLAVSHLSDILAGKGRLSRQRATAVAARLRLKPFEQSYFALLVALDHAEEDKDVQKIKKKMAALRSEIERVVADDAFRYIADWHHGAIFALASLPTFESDPAWIARSLGLTVEEARAAIERLVRMGLLKYDGARLVPGCESWKTGDTIPSAAVQQFHQQILERALRTITSRQTGERHLGARIMAFRSSRLPEVKQRLTELRKEFAAEFSDDTGSADSLYCLSVQFFPLLEST